MSRSEDQPASRSYGRKEGGMMLIQRGSKVGNLWQL
jgi:hypothetical protein